ncbi:HAD-IIA family hydrolase [Variovorax saccharolyticus]|uniref:HAD-IIA family hydrolase n=1 Tax=Variovorax saccharolyticus TaxID=3053516 RepID=UPI0025760A54|nr:HAD-IIA family hydrolase [Variovorax sp. J22R187]MDM0020829.1 HAD-IIA family hydrolase [Variovorax sp. J22R187]
MTITEDFSLSGQRAANAPADAGPPSLQGHPDERCGPNVVAADAASVALDVDPIPQHLILDLDGTLIREDEALPGAAELLARYRGRCVIVSNNSTHTAQGVTRRLARMGLDVEAAQLVLAGEVTIAHLRHAHTDARILLAGSAALRRHALDQGCALVRADADLVVLALDPHFNRARLALMANELRCGARLIATNGDDNHPGPDGSLVPETGALLAALVAASGTAPLAVIGKPGPRLFEEGMRRLGRTATRANTLVIGDNPATDLRGATAFGLRALLVGPRPEADAATLPELLARLDRSLPRPTQYRLSESTSKVLRSVLTEVS